MPCTVMSAHAAHEAHDRINVAGAIENGVGEGVECGRRSGRGSLSPRFFSTHVNCASEDVL